MSESTPKTRVILIELANDQAIELAFEHARAGHSVGLAFDAMTESAVADLQLKLERLGGISFAINLSEGGMSRAIDMMIDLFGHIDEIACFTEQAATEAAKKLPSKRAPLITRHFTL